MLKDIDIINELYVTQIQEMGHGKIRKNREFIQKKEKVSKTNS